jgi:hypothetical protein
MDRRSGVQHVDQALLDPLPGHVIQRIDLHGLAENLLELSADPAPEKR